MPLLGGERRDTPTHTPTQKPQEVRRLLHIYDVPTLEDVCLQKQTSNSRSHMQKQMSSNKRSHWKQVNDKSMINLAWRTLVSNWNAACVQLECQGEKGELAL